MITFKQFLSEDASALEPEDAAKFIATHCREVLDDLGLKMIYGTNPVLRGQFLWRGLGDLPKNKAHVLDGTRTRIPVDSSAEMTDTMNAYFQKAFNYPYRTKGVFVIGNRSFAASYGNVFSIFPVDGYNCIWSPRVEDAFMAFDQRGHGEMPSMARTVCNELEIDNPFDPHSDVPIPDQDAAWDEWWRILLRWLEQTNPYEDGRLLKGLENIPRPEIMLKCKQYIAIPTSEKFEIEMYDYLAELL